jgi:glycosyltransferase involved in cell wall biosynthesis
MRVLIAVIDLAGGTGTFCRTLAAGLKRYFASEFHLSLLLLRERGLIPEDQAAFDDIHVLGSEVHNDWRRVFETPLHLLKIRRAVKGIPSDVIFCVGTYANLLIPLVAPGRKVILSVHTDSTAQLRDARFGGLIGKLMKWRYPPHLLVAPAEGVAKDLKEHFAAQHTRTILHAVDGERIQRLAEQTVADLPAKPYVVACGRLTAQKDYPTLLRAYAQADLAEDLLIVGEGEDRPILEALARELGIEHRVHLLGHRDNPFPYMKPASFFVLSSIWEGFGLVVLEAMTLGLACVATDCPSGPGEILGGGEYGLLIRPGDVEGLAEAMRKLSRNQALREDLGRRSLLRAEQLNLKRMASEYRELLLEQAER